jgi:hypothetical protein
MSRHRADGRATVSSPGRPIGGFKADNSGNPTP